MLLSCISIIALFKLISKACCSASAPSKSWYQFDLGTPLYVTRNASYGIGKLVFILMVVIVCLLMLLPYQRLEGIQSCITSGLGTYYFTMHITALVLNIILMRFEFITAYLCIFLALVAAVFSINPKFSSLFLSIGGAYIITLLLCALVNVGNYFIYCFTFIPVFVLCAFFKRKKEHMHYLIVKALVLTLSALLVVHLIIPVPFITRVFIFEDSSIFERLISIGIFMGVFVLFYAFAFIKEKVQGVLAKK